MDICLEQSAYDLHMVQLMPLPPIISCFIKIQKGSPFLVPDYCQMGVVVISLKIL